MSRLLTHGQWESGAVFCLRRISKILYIWNPLLKETCQHFWLNSKCNLFKTNCFCERQDVSQRQNESWGLKCLDVVVMIEEVVMKSILFTDCKCRKGIGIVISAIYFINFIHILWYFDTSGSIYMLPWHRNVKNFLKYGEWYFVHAWSKTPHIILDNSIKNNKGLLYDNKTSIIWFLLRRTTISIVYHLPSQPFLSISVTSMWLWQFCIITKQMISDKHSDSFKI